MNIEKRVGQFLKDIKDNDTASLNKAIAEGILEEVAQGNCNITWSDFINRIAHASENVDIVAKIISYASWVKNAESSNLLSWAIKHNQVEIVKNLIENGADIHKTIPANGCFYGITMLYTALVYSDYPIIAMLINAKADVNQKSGVGVLPLHQAIMYNKGIEVIKLLIEAGADLNSLRNNNISILEDAAQRISDKGMVEMFELLVSSGANLNLRGDHGASILSAATCKHYGQMNGKFLEPLSALVYRLLEYGAPITKENANYVLGWACIKGDINIVKQILKLDVNLRQGVCKGGGSPLYLAVDNGHIELVKLLAKAHQSLDSSSTGHNTPLSLAIIKHDILMVKTLIELGASLNTRTGQEGKGLVQLAVELKSEPTLELLINNKANLDMVSCYRDTALHKALEQDTITLATKLIKGGCNVNILSRAGATPFHIAIARQDTALMAELLKANANLALENFEGDSILKIAYQTGQISHIINMLLELKKSADIAVHVATEHIDKIVSYALNNSFYELAVPLLEGNYTKKQSLEEYLSTLQLMDHSLDAEVAGKLLFMMEEKVAAADPHYSVEMPELDHAYLGNHYDSPHSEVE